MTQLLAPRRPAVTPTELAEQALTRARHPVARLVSLAEDSRSDAAARCDEAMAVLEASAQRRNHVARVIGITGSPGSGKSSLVSRVSNAMIAADPDLTVAVVAVDPSSPSSGGALLGDRTRMVLEPGQDRIYFRSQASATALGGLAPTTFQVCRVLSLIFNYIIVETVGVGQSEADVRHLADRVFLVMAPLGGDEIQYLKAGILEIPDAFVVNKWDEPAATRTYHQLRGSLGLARPNDAHHIPIYRTSAKTGHGIDELAHGVLTMVTASNATPVRERAPHFFTAWVRDEWGRVGARHLAERLGGARAFLAAQDGFAAARRSFDASIRAALHG
ncbi:MAG: hypothetical protein U1E66_10635 [Rhodospirillales bacterium]